MRNLQIIISGVTGILLFCMLGRAQDPTSTTDRPVKRRGTEAAADRIMTSLDYQELRLMRARIPDHPPAGNPEKAADVEDLKVPPKAADEIARAQRSLEKKKPEAALEHLKKAAAIYPKYSKTYNNMGLIYRELGRMQEAEAAFVSAIEINPKNATAQRNLGFVYLVSNRPERAIGPLAEAGRLDHADAAAKAFLGDAMFRTGRLAEAETALKGALTINPDFYAAAYRLGCIYAQQRKFVEAIALLEKVLKVNHPGLETSGIEALLSRLRDATR